MSDLTPPRLTLIGTVHRDREGEGKMRLLLERLQPTEITLEMSPAALEYRRRRTDSQLQRLDEILDSLAEELDRDPGELRKLPVVEDIRQLLALPYEYRATASYAEASRIPMSLIDISEISSAKLEKVEKELVTYRNLRILVNLPPLPGAVDKEGYLPARAMVMKTPRAEVRRTFLDQRRGLEGIGIRDRLMAEAIRQRMQKTRGHHLVHVGGWVHLVEDERGETLFSRLGDLGPQRLLLE